MNSELTLKNKNEIDIVFVCVPRMMIPRTQEHIHELNDSHNSRTHIHEHTNTHTQEHTKIHAKIWALNSGFPKIDPGDIKSGFKSSKNRLLWIIEFKF